MIKDITSLFWCKNIYYTSDNVIFDIAQKRKSKDLDECATYLADMENAPDNIKAIINGRCFDISLYPEIFNKNVPYIEISFSDTAMTKCYPLQYMVEEGDKIIDDSAVQYHPNVYDTNYINKFVYEIFDYIESLYNSQKNFNFDEIMKNLPAWLTKTNSDAIQMTKRYANTYFLRGYAYDENKAIEKIREDEELITFTGAKIYNNKDTFAQMNFWTRDVVLQAITAIYSQKVINEYNEIMENALDGKHLSTDYLRLLGERFNTIATTDTDYEGTFKVFPHITFEQSGSINQIEFASKVTKGDTYYED